MPENIEATYAKLEHFTSLITSDAMNDARKMQESIKQEREQILTAAEDDALNDTFRYIKSQVQQIRTQSGRDISKRVMENKRALALRRSEMSAQTLDRVKVRLAQYVQAPEYKAQLRQLIARALEAFHADATIYLRAEDMPLAEELSDASPFHVEFQEGEFQLGGIRAACTDRHMQIDESFDTTLEELSDHFAELFGLKMADADKAE